MTQNFNSYSGTTTCTVPQVSLLWDRLLSDETSAADYICKEGIPESLWLEFKTKRTSGSHVLEDGDKRALGEALSAFSNAEGGLLVWGIKTARGNAVDCAHVVRPISDISRFEGAVRSLIAGYQSPSNDGVQVRALKTSPGSDCGLLLVLIPRGPNRPYMSCAKDHHRYYRRTSSGTLVLEHYEVVDLIRADRSPSLSVELICRLSQYTGESSQFEAALLLTNTGSVPATRPYLWIHDHDNAISFSDAVGFSKRQDPIGLTGALRFNSVSPRELLPGDWVEVATTPFYCRGQVNQIADYHWGIQPSRNDHFPRQALVSKTVRLEIGASNCSRRELSFCLEQEYLLAQAYELLEKHLKSV